MRIQGIPQSPVAAATIIEQTGMVPNSPDYCVIRTCAQRADDPCLQRQPCLFPGVQASFKDEGFASATYFLCQPGRITRSSRTALAMKDDGLAFVQRKVGLVQLGYP